MSVSLSLEKQAQAIDEEVDCGLLGTSQKRAVISWNRFFVNIE